MANHSTQPQPPPPHERSPSPSPSPNGVGLPSDGCHSSSSNIFHPRPDRECSDCHPRSCACGALFLFFADYNTHITIGGVDVAAGDSITTATVDAYATTAAAAAASAPNATADAAAATAPSPPSTTHDVDGATSVGCTSHWRT